MLMIAELRSMLLRGGDECGIAPAVLSRRYATAFNEDGLVALTDSHPGFFVPVRFEPFSLWKDSVQNSCCVLSSKQARASVIGSYSWELSRQWWLVHWRWVHSRAPATAHLSTLM